MEKKSLYQYIKENIVNGQLPEKFSLSSDMPKNKIRFADGAADGIAIYHMGGAEVSEESMDLLQELMHDISDGRYDIAREKLKKFAEQNTPINAIDDFEKFIFDHTSWIDSNKLYDFAIECMMSSNIDIVKYGLEMAEVFSNPSEEMKEIVRTLGLCEEFTIFSIFHMQGWDNSNQELFALAQKVHGWGRIHIIKRLEPETEEIKKWLLKEGIVNTILFDYSALEVYNKAEVRTLLKMELTEEEINSIAVIISSLISEEPVAGISSIEDGNQMLLDFLNQVRHFEPSLTLCETVLSIQLAERSKEIDSICKEILYADKVKEAVINWVKEGKALKLAKNLNKERM